MLPPGRAMLATKPLATGSLSRSPATMGMVAVAACAARTAAGLIAAIRSTLRVTRSAAIGASGAASPPVTRAMMLTCSGRIPPACNPLE